MALVPPQLVGTAAGFLNTLRGAAEALVIAAFSASLLAVLTNRLGDAKHAADVSAGRLAETGSAERDIEIDAFTGSWHITQIGVGTVSLILAITIAILLFARTGHAREKEPHAQHI